MKTRTHLRRWTAAALFLLAATACDINPHGARWSLQPQQRTLPNAPQTNMPNPSALPVAPAPAPVHNAH